MHKSVWILTLLASQLIGCASIAQNQSEGQRLYDQASKLDLTERTNKKIAVPLFLRAAQLGHSDSQAMAGWLYEKGIVVTRNFETAATWYRKAADQGNSLGLERLGRMYEDGIGVPQDWRQAAQLYKESADKGNAKGEFLLGRAYQFGIGVPQNRSTAIYWFQRAGNHGHSRAGDEARRLSFPGNFIGFMDEYEHAFVINGKLRFSSELHGADPAGQLFNNAKERGVYIVSLRARVDSDEANIRALSDEFDSQLRERRIQELMDRGYSQDEARRRL